MKNILFIFFLGSSLLIFNGCEKDPCEATICNNGGYCANGDCVCPEGFTGSDCSQQETPTKIQLIMGSGIASSPALAVKPRSIPL